MPIDNPEKFVAGIWDWAVLDGCFGAGHIRPTDIDGAVERNGRMLLLETKQPGAEIPYGQHVMFLKASQSGYVTTFVVWGPRGSPVQMAQYHKGQVRPARLCDIQKLRSECERWYEWANEQHSGTISHTPPPRFINETTT